jgi:hypothetical protein
VQEESLFSLDLSTDHSKSLLSLRITIINKFICVQAQETKQNTKQHEIQIRTQNSKIISWFGDVSILRI